MIISVGVDGLAFLGAPGYIVVQKETAFSSYRLVS